MVQVEIREIGKQIETHPSMVVGIPAFNEENTIAKVIIVAQKYADIVVVCDDGSNDMTAAIARRVGAEVITHDRNLGYGASINSLLAYAKELSADVLVTLDGDGQHDAEEIPKIVEPILSKKADIVIGSRFINNCGTSEMPLYRKVGAQFITKMVNGSAKNGISDSQSGFRAYGHEAINNLSPKESGMGASVEILLVASKKKFKIYEVPSKCKYIGNGAKTSKQNPVGHGFGVFTSIMKLVVEERPLVYLGIPGIISLIVGIFFSIWMFQIYSLEQRIVTNLALASVAFVLIGFFALSTAITLYVIVNAIKRK